MRLEPRELASRGFRFVKLRANLILNRGGVAADIHPGDLPDLLARFGIDLIAEKIESEGSVVDLLDYDVKFGQGFLFSPPRPVRAEALQGITDRNDVVARDSTAIEPATPPARTAARGCARPASPGWCAASDQSPPDLTRGAVSRTHPDRAGRSVCHPPHAAKAIRAASPAQGFHVHPAPPFTPHFATLAAAYDVVLCDVWGVVHNSIVAFAEACTALARFPRGRAGPWC